MSHQCLLIVLTGPTAVGKTALCLSLAARLGSEIVSADARQCYQGMAIGTAQPTAAELAEVPHHLVGFLSAQVRYSAGAYAQDALACLGKLWTRSPYALLVGGSGFYIQAVCQGLPSIPPVDRATEEELDRVWRAGGAEGLLGELAQVDPACYAIVDRQNPKRVLRALAVWRTTGQPYSSFAQRAAVRDGQVPRPFQVIKIGLTRPREELYQRIDARVDQMIADGLVREAERFFEKRHLPALQTIGYKECFSYLEGRIDLPTAIQLIKRNTRHYAKRQLSWWRRDPDLLWYHPSELPLILAKVQALATPAA